MADDATGAIIFTFALIFGIPIALAMWSASTVDERKGKQLARVAHSKELEMKRLKVEVEQSKRLHGDKLRKKELNRRIRELTRELDSLFYDPLFDD